MTARGEATTAELQDAVWAELLACYGEGEDTDWPYLKDLTDLIVEMIGRHSASERARSQRLQEENERLREALEVLLSEVDPPHGSRPFIFHRISAIDYARRALKDSSDA